MKMERLFAYAAAGIIVGLLIENRLLVTKQNATAKAREAKKKVEKLGHDLRERVMA